MRTLASLIRSPSFKLISTIRGPKKKGQAEAKIQSNDIINIFKDRPDPEPRDIRQYPIFVQQMSMNPYSIHQLLYAIQNDIKHIYPGKPYYKSLINGLKRQRCKTIRNYKQLDQGRIDKSEENDYHDRNALYDIFAKSQEQLQQDRKAAQAAQAEQDDEDDI